jgi:hypothetical protein
VYHSQPGVDFVRLFTEWSKLFLWVRITDSCMLSETSFTQHDGPGSSPKLYTLLPHGAFLITKLSFTQVAEAEFLVEGFPAWAALAQDEECVEAPGASK